jgi:transaldolase
LINLYLDSSDKDVVVNLLSTGLFKGITTNPVILQKSKHTFLDLPDIYKWAKNAGAEEIFFQSFGSDKQTIISNAHKILKISPEIIIKVVANPEGIAACRELSKSGVKTLLTAVYSPIQAVVADTAGADFIAPYLGKMQDLGRSGFDEVTQMHNILSTTNSTTKILLASVRDIDSIVRMSQVGINHFTISTQLAKDILNDEASNAAIKVFNEITGN